jgi:two-component system nitrogen regulation sensor histidine kinase NtrY
MLSKNAGENTEYIQVLKIAKERLINLNLFTKRFADIVHIPPPDVSKCDVKEVIDHVLICFQTEFEQKSIKVRSEFAAGKMLISFDYLQLEMAITNIIKNAVQAIDTDGIINIVFKNTPPMLIIENNGESLPDSV